MSVQQSLPGLEPAAELIVDVEQYIGLTPWLIAASNPPPMVGWWKTRKLNSPELLQPQRRWWNGQHFSIYVLPWHLDVEVWSRSFEPSYYHNDQIEWCGLRLPHPAGYAEYALHYPGARIA